MDQLEKIYPKEFFMGRNKVAWRTKIVCPPIIQVLKPKKLIDVGCGTGDFVSYFLQQKIDAYGLEGTTEVLDNLMIPDDRMYFADLRKPFLQTVRFDLAMSIEVAEHIEPEFSHIYVHNMCSLSDRILLTVAGPGQLGHNHVNLQTKDYWEKKFAKHGYFRKQEIENQILALFEPHKRKQVMRAFMHNLMYLERNPSWKAS